MPKMIDITGQRFGQLTAIKSIEQRDRKFYWLCRCDCGVTTVVQGKKLRNGHTQSCGHLRRDGLKATHGEARKGRESSEYSTWKAMLQRCENPNDKSYKFYGGRGIKVCERWHRYENFIADMGRRPPGCELDRYPNNDGNYEPNNCRWTTHSEQMKNKRY
jgi:hypothetical protein